MKKTRCSLALAVLFLYSCKKSAVVYTPDCSGTTKSFATDVSPVIKSYCATSGCHDSNSSHGPGALTNYTQISGNRTSVRSAVADGSMPQNTTLSNAQKNAIMCWIDNGAPNN